MIQRGIDTFVTTADGTTFIDFAHNPIPAGFFCKSSKTFTGKVGLKGLPVETGVPRQLGAADTIVERLDDAVFDAQAPLAIAARLTFIPVKPARNKAARKLEMAGSINFPAIPLPWSLGSASAKRLNSVVVDTDGDLKPDTLVPGHSNFLAGLAPNARRTKSGNCVCYMVCHDNDGEQHCTWVYDGICMEPPC